MMTRRTNLRRRLNVILLEHRLTPTTITVLNLNDNGTASLREAVAITNLMPGADTIVFAPSLTGSITLTTGAIDITGSLTIHGTNPNVITVSGNKASRIFNCVGATSSDSISISGLTLQDAKAIGDGGAIRLFDENLSVSNCTFLDNAVTINTGSGAAIGMMGGAGGSITVQQCTFEGNESDSGGAISIFASTGRVVVNQSTFSGNDALSGGGAISTYGKCSLNVTSSTFSSNITSGNGRQGGAILFQGQVGTDGFNIVNCTLTGNTSVYAGGAIAFLYSTDTMNVTNCTITNNAAYGLPGGGGIAVGNSAGVVNLVSSIVSDNFTPISNKVDLSSGVVTGKACAIGSVLGVDTYINLGGNLPLFSNLNLANPANNGGPTATVALLPGSPCINAGSNTLALTNDQRGVGFSRSVGQTDIGAFEVQPAPAKVTGVSINSKGPTAADKAQRSRVTDVAITLDSKVSFVASAASAFTLNKVGGGSVTLAATLDATGTIVTLTFTGGAVDYTSLADGRYALHALATQFSGAGLDGDSNGTARDDFVFDQPSAPAILDATKLFRLFGDANGDGTVAANDFIQFRLALGGNSAMFDFDGDGAVAASDFIQFRLRFGGSI